jgi:cytosine deaminase
MTQHEDDARFLAEAVAEARKGLAEGGIPIGAVLVRDGKIIGRGHNRRVQDGDPIAHGEMSAFRDAGRQASYRDVTLYTTLSPCMMCSGTIVQFGVGRVVIGEAETFGGNETFLRARGAAVRVLDDAECKAMMADFIRDNPVLWNEDIARVEA